MDGGVKDKKWALMQVLNNFSTAYGNAIDGGVSDIGVQGLYV